mmetsp:Transcript_6813/g.19688  ORF Transcript_6813/g.19688 Transcript_6813/m.19688 type:complete len:99 (+) Transcript_6813:421-717(+)
MKTWIHKSRGTTSTYGTTKLQNLSLLHAAKLMQGLPYFQSMPVRKTDTDVSQVASWLEWSITCLGPHTPVHWKSEHKMLCLGIEPRTSAWKADILPLN